MSGSIRRRINWTGVGYFAVVALMLAGCGGGGGGGSSLSRHEFVTRANAVCRQAQGEVKALPAPTPGDLASYSTVIASQIPIITDALRKLKALTPPSDLESRYRTYVSDGETEVGKLSDLRAAAEAGNGEEALKLANDIEATSDDSIATDLGLTECAKNVQPQG
jgi:hypothetical protein